MPELPEVETTRRGIEPHLRGRSIARLILRDTRLRWPVSPEIAGLAGHEIVAVTRRGKYLLLQLDEGHLIWHLGMSGSLRILPRGTPPAPHEHVEIELDDGQALKFRDPRRFGALLYTAADPLAHPLLASLGPEPLGDGFDADYLHWHCRGRKLAIKNLLMNSRIVAGVGNIYASESLYLAGIRPGRAARRVSKPRAARLVAAVRAVLADAIAHGGTTLRDFTRADGKPGYFRHELKVYGNSGACPACGQPIRQAVIGQRATYYCPACQT